MRVFLYEVPDGHLVSPEMLIAERSIPMTGNAFSGCFQVPKAPFEGLGNWRVVMKLDYPQSTISYSVPLVIAAVYR